MRWLSTEDAKIFLKKESIGEEQKDFQGKNWLVKCVGSTDQWWWGQLMQRKPPGGYSICWAEQAAGAALRWDCGDQRTCQKAVTGLRGPPPTELPRRPEVDAGRSRCLTTRPRPDPPAGPACSAGGTAGGSTRLAAPARGIPATSAKL